MSNLANQENEKNIAIVYRPDTKKALTLALKLIPWLNRRGYKVFTASQQKLLPGTKFVKFANNPKDSTKGKSLHLVIVLGGDGTYLRAVRFLKGAPIPILGVNLGSLGFLTETRAANLFSTLTLALKNKLLLKPRSMIEATIRRKGKEIATFNGLNDVVLARGGRSQLIDISINNDTRFVNTIRADGLIVASPTGSTAYNLSAGGPILHPKVKAFVVTPIAPHSLSSRPLIFSDESNLVLKVKGTREKTILVIDGLKVADVTKNDEILIKKSSQDHFLLRHPKDDFFALLREKLNFN